MDLKKKDGFEMKYGFAKKKMLGFCNVMREYQEVWIWKKIMAIRRSMDLQKKKIGICNIMKDYQEVWIWKKNNGSETKYGLAEKKWWVFIM